MKKRLLLLVVPVFFLSIVSCGQGSSNRASSNASTQPSVIYHTVSFDSAGGSSVFSQKVQHGGKIKKPDNPSKTGHRFINWTYNSEEWLFSKNTVEFDLTLLANWNVNSYEVRVFNSNWMGGSVSGEGVFNYGTYVTLVATPNKGYSFKGWYDMSDTDPICVSNEATYTFELVCEKFLTAEWNSSKNVLSVTSNDDSKGSVSVSSGSGYTGEQITVSANPSENNVFLGWYEGQKRISDLTTYSFEMPNEDYSLVGRFVDEDYYNSTFGARPILNSSNNTIQYGLYPNNYIDDPILIQSIETYGVKSTNNWYFYNDAYYTRAMPTGCALSHTFINGKEMVQGTYYWFKCEPIVWKIFSSSDDEYCLVSDRLIDAQRYNEYYYGTKNGVYSNNYEHSEIRSWLNDNFFKTAFALGNSFIQTTTVDNSAPTTESDNNNKICNDTEDKVFLMSYKEYYDFYQQNGSPYALKAKMTNWAVIRGADYNESSNSETIGRGNYWTRSPSSSDVSQANYVNRNGALSSYIVSTTYCVRPAITLKKS